MVLQLFTASLFLASVPPAIELVVDEREPVAMMVKTPRGELASSRISEILEVANAAFRKHTGLRVDSMEIAGVDPVILSKCDRDEQLSCWSRLLLNAYANESDRPSPKLLIVTSVIPDSKQGDRFSSLLIDLAQVRSIMENAPRDANGQARSIEDTIFERAVETVSGFELVPDLESAGRYFDELITQKLRRKLQEIGQWLPFGGIRLTGGKGLTVRLEDQLIGSLEQDVVVLQGLRAGKRRLELKSIDGAIRPIRLDEMIQAGRIRDVFIKKIPNLEGLETSKTIMRWTGLGTALIGASIAVTALMLPVQSQTITPCVGEACSMNETRAFARACDYSRLELGESCNGLDSVLVAPLGYSLVASGVGLSSLSFVDDETGSFRWWAPLASLAIGAISYGVSSL